MNQKPTSLRPVVIVAESGAPTATKRELFSCSRPKRPVLSAKESAVSTVALPGGLTRKASMTKPDSPEGSFDPVRKHAFLETFQEIPVGHAGNKIPGEPGRRSFAQVVPADPGSLDKVRKNFRAVSVCFNIGKVGRKQDAVHGPDLLPLRCQFRVVVNMVPRECAESGKRVFDLTAIRNKTFVVSIAVVQQVMDQGIDDSAVVGPEDLLAFTGNLCQTFDKAHLLRILEIAPDEGDRVSEFHDTPLQGHGGPGPVPFLVCLNFPVKRRPVRTGFRGNTEIIGLSVMAEDPVKHLHGQVLILDPVKGPYALYVMEKFPEVVFFAEIREAGFAEVSVRDVTDIVPERDRLNQVLVEPQAPADSTCDLRDELDMDHPVGDVIVLHKIKNLGLVDVPRICPGM